MDAPNVASFRQWLVERLSETYLRRRPGESDGDMAARYGVTLDALQEARILYDRRRLGVAPRPLVQVVKVPIPLEVSLYVDAACEKLGVTRSCVVRSVVEAMLRQGHVPARAGRHFRGKLLGPERTSIETKVSEGAAQAVRARLPKLREHGIRSMHSYVRSGLRSYLEGHLRPVPLVMAPGEQSNDSRTYRTPLKLPDGTEWTPLKDEQ